MSMISFYTQLEEENKIKLDRLSSLKGLKKNFIINEALKMYFDTLQEIPEEYIIKPIYVNEKEFERIKNLEVKPTESLKRLLND
ncbi:hypothetical protein [Nautilia sp.]